MNGHIEEGRYVGRLHKQQVAFAYQVYIPTVAPGTACALLLDHDGLNGAMVEAMETLTAAGEAPPCVILGVVSGAMSPSLPCGTTAGMRMDNYDVFGPEYPAFITEELLPYVVEQHGLCLSPSPDMGCVAGGSSGGISAWNMAWYRGDRFRRVYMSSPSFLEMAKGTALLSLMRKCEPKPIRVWTEYSENEPNDYFGNSVSAAVETEKALAFAGYDMQARYYPGEGHCSRYGHAPTLTEAFRFLWKDWETTPVAPAHPSPRVSRLVSPDEPWREIDRPFPAKAGAVSSGRYSAAGQYVPCGNTVVFKAADGTERTVAEGFGQVTACAVSSDKWRLYVSDAQRGCVYFCRILPDGSLEGRFLHGALHLNTDFIIPGATDLCADTSDRVYAATELGIQVIRSFGLIDVILPLPDGLIPERVEFGEEDPCVLYAEAGGRVFCRAVKEGQRYDPDRVDTPLCRDYYD